jgi:hypothetical protein
MGSCAPKDHNSGPTQADYERLLHVAALFLKRKATIGELRAIVKDLLPRKVPA